MSIPSIPSYSMPAVNSFPESKVSWQIDPEKAVLLVHDMQNYFVRFYGENNALLHALQRNIGAIRTWADRWGIPVVYTAQPEDQSPEDRALLTDMWGTGLSSTDPDAKNIVPELAPRQQDTVLVKWRYSAFQRSPLQSMMQQWRRDQLLITGIYAHIGCMITATDAFMQDIKPFLVGDAVADFSAEEHGMAMRYVAGRSGRVVSTQSIVDSAKPTITKDWLKQQLLACIGDDEEFFDPADNLIDYGLDSIQVMSMLEEWQRMGMDITLEDLAKEPTMNGWWNLIEKKCQVL
jgi:bifunctional isochorismate lyase/aryl carrier protein